ncbi:MAG: hypothetical protein HKP40_11305 [Litoreibacter sp.]|nr:hypothetical protein [Litoreibacter sp.]
MRRIFISLGFVALVGTVSACDNDAERGMVGAAAGGAVADATGGDVVTGAILGGIAGVFCDDAGVCK